MVDGRDRPAAGALERLRLEETDWRVAGYVWAERRRFEVLGGWVASVPELEAKVMLAVHARHHAWHSSLWSAYVPRRSGHVASGHDLPACLKVLDDPNGMTTTIERLVGAYRVLAPCMIRAYDDHLARASTISDAALVRTTRLVLAEQRDDAHRGEMVLQSLLDSDASRELASAHQVRLEKVLLVGG